MINSRDLSALLAECESGGTVSEGGCNGPPPGTGNEFSHVLEQFQTPILGIYAD